MRGFPRFLFVLSGLCGIAAETTIPPPPELPGLCGFSGPPCSIDEIYRRYDGSCSNTFNSDFGFVGSRYLYLLSPVYDDGISKPRIKFNGELLPEARLLRNTFFPEGNPTNDKYVMTLMSWGQLWAHDLSLLNERDDGNNCCTKDGKHVNNTSDNCIPINIPTDDPILSSLGVECLNFSRILTDQTLHCVEPIFPALPINTVTPALDLSPVYGNSVFENSNLRTFVDGQLRTESRNNMTYPPTIFSQGFCSVLYETGDFRSNQNAPLLLLHMAFINNHNTIAKKLQILNPTWSDDILFEETRRIMIAIFQKITYYEWFPILFGPDIASFFGVTFNTADYVNDFDMNIDLGATNENSHAASRVLHSIIPNTIDLYNEDRVLQSSITLSDNFFCQELFEEPDKIRQAAMGLITQPIGDFDEFYPKSIANDLFKLKDASFGGDLRSIDIQRSRDVALAPYIEYAKMCGVVDPTKIFGDFRDFNGLFSKNVIKKMSKVYKSSAAVDLFTGLALELPAKGSKLGPTTLCLLLDQSLRSRIGDEKWFEHVECNFQIEQVNAIRAVTLSKFLCEGLNISKIQENAFLAPSDSNPIKACSDLPELNLNFWKNGLDNMRAMNRMLLRLNINK